MNDLHESLEPTDEYLVMAARAGSDSCLHELLRRFRPRVRLTTRRLFINGGDVDDVVQEGMIGLYKAIKSYDEDRGPFQRFADYCVSRQVYSAIEHARRHKHAPLLTSERFSTMTDASLPEAPHETDPEHTTLARLELEEVLIWCQSRLTDLEREVLSLYVEGETYESIAETLDAQVKVVDNALQRVKRKLAGYAATKQMAGAAA